VWTAGCAQSGPTPSGSPQKGAAYRSKPARRARKVVLESAFPDAERV